MDGIKRGAGSRCGLKLGFGGLGVDWVKWSDKVGWIWSGNYLVVCLV